jgi:hypothetical protein
VPDRIGSRRVVTSRRICATADLLPIEDRDKPIEVLAETIKPISFHVGGDSDAVENKLFATWCG